LGVLADLKKKMSAQSDSEAVSGETEQPGTEEPKPE
jgi:hypothetical protein